MRRNERTQQRCSVRKQLANIARCSTNPGQTVGERSNAMSKNNPFTPAYWTHQVCEITPELFLSAALPYDLDEALAVLEAWRAAGITDYVDVRIEDDASEFFAEHAPDIRYWRAPADDHLGLQDHSWWTQANELIHAAFARGGKCMVTCAIGVNRSPSIVFSTLLTLGWEVEAALTQVRRARPVAVAPYADQAAVWHALTQGKSETEVASLRRRVQRWHQQNPIDAPRVIRSIHNRLAS
jgi:protein-tyrosine phosphatase